MNEDDAIKVMRGPKIINFFPEEGWPGSLLTIHGEGFSSKRDALSVNVGGAEALVIEAEPDVLQVLVGQNAMTGKICINIDGCGVPK